MARQMTNRAHFRAILRLGLPLIASHLAQMAVHVTDTVMLGWYDVDALAAVSLAVPLFVVLFLVGSGFAWAITPVIAAAAASGQGAQVRRVTRMAMWLSALFAACVMPLFLFSDALLQALGQRGDLAKQAAAYLTVFGWSIFPALQIMVLKSYLSALEHPRAILVVTLVAAVANGVLNYALIFGNWGAPEMGIFGAAVASLTINTLSLAALAAYCMVATREHTLFRRLWRPDWEAFCRVFSLGWPIGLTSLAEAGLFSAVAVLMGWLGKVELAAHGIAIQLASLTFIVHVGLSQVATIRAGQAFGRGDPEDLRRGAILVLAISAGFALATVVLFLAAPEFLVGLFIDPTDPERPQVLALGVTLLAVAALFQLADGGQVMALGLLRGLQDTRVPMMIAVIAYWPLGLGAAYYLGFELGFGATGVWLGLVVGLGVAAIWMMVRFWTRGMRLASGR